MKNIIEISHLNKSFGEVKAVCDLSFLVRDGELFAFLGVNGAGKSTTINMICGQLMPDSGRITIDSYDIDENENYIKRSLGVVFQNSVLDKSLTVKDNLESRGALYGLEGAMLEDRIKELSEMLNFGNLLKRTVAKLSGGERRRIDIARALIHRPKILILDEPTTGLDPQTRKLLWEVIDKLRREENMTVFLTTHYMEEAADSNYVVIIDGGKIVAQGSPIELKNKYSGDFVTLYGVDEVAVKSLNIPYEVVPGGYRISVPDTVGATNLIVEHRDLFTDYEVTKGRMDDVFISVTGRKLTGGEE